MPISDKITDVNLIDAVIEAKKIKGLKWDELAEGLSMNGDALGISFRRKKVDKVFFNHVCKKLGINLTDENLSENEINSLIENFKPEDYYKKGSKLFIENDIEKGKITKSDIRIAAIILMKYKELAINDPLYKALITEIGLKAILDHKTKEILKNYK